jgi:hypothetical protein
MIPAAFPDYSPASQVRVTPLFYLDSHSTSQGLLYIGLIVGTIVAEALCSGRLSDYLVTKLSKSGPRSPEHRLWLYWPAALFSAIGLALFGCSVQYNWHWMVCELSLAILAFGVQIGEPVFPEPIPDLTPNRKYNDSIILRRLLPRPGNGCHGLLQFPPEPFSICQSVFHRPLGRAERLGAIVWVSGGYCDYKCPYCGALSPDIWQEVARREIISLARRIVTFSRLLL